MVRFVPIVSALSGESEMRELTLKCNEDMFTDGSGLWSDVATPVTVTKVEVVDFRDDEDDPDSFGEMQVYFTPESWNIQKHGLIYTDRLFKKDLATFLGKLGIAENTFCYSEQGMQGDDYVSFDVWGSFFENFAKVI